MVLWVELPAAGATALSCELERQGVLLAPGPSFAPEGGLDRFVRIPYPVPAPQLEEAVRRIATAWAVVRGGDAPAEGTGPSGVLVA